MNELGRDLDPCYVPIKFGRDRRRIAPRSVVTGFVSTDGQADGWTDRQTSCLVAAKNQRSQTYAFCNVWISFLPYHPHTSSGMTILLHLAPVPLSIFRSNSKFDENSECSSFEYTRPITTIFCTRHDSDTVVTCAKYRCDRPRILYTRVFWIFIEFRIRSKYA